MGAAAPAAVEYPEAVDAEWGFWGTKKGHLVPSWKRRWFVVSPKLRTVTYWASDTVATSQVGAKPKGVIRLASAIEKGADVARNEVIMTDQQAGKKPKRYPIRVEKKEVVAKLMETLNAVDRKKSRTLSQSMEFAKK